MRIVDSDRKIVLKTPARTIEGSIPIRDKLLSDA